jgi:WhiB family redox-sensing transcriptional regulator
MIPTFMLETDVVPLCSKIDPDVFFPVDDSLENPGNSSKLITYSDERLAKAICDACPLKLPCALYAIQTGPQGIWGGTTESERLAIRRGRGVKLQKSLGLAPTKRR